MPATPAANNRLCRGPESPGFQDSRALGTLEMHAVRENYISFKIMNSAHVALGQ